MIQIGENTNLNYFVIPGVVRVTKVTMDEIQNVVSNYTGVTVEQLCKRGRKRQVVFARQLITYLSRKRTGLTLKEIGGFFGQDHTTAIHSCESIKGYIDIGDIQTCEAIRIVEMGLS